MLTLTLDKRMKSHYATPWYHWIHQRKTSVSRWTCPNWNFRAEGLLQPWHCGTFNVHTPDHQWWNQTQHHPADDPSETKWKDLWLLLPRLWFRGVAQTRYKTQCHHCLRRA